MFHRMRIVAAAVALLLVAIAAQASFARQPEADLLATLQDPDASRFDRSIACKELAVVGTEAAVAPLAALLDDEAMSHMARYALEPNPSPEVDEVLLSALATLEGKHLIGVIQSIANRGNPEACEALTALLDHEDPDVAAAAAHALARIGAEVPSQRFIETYPAATLVLGKTLSEQGNPDAVSVLVKLYGVESAPSHIRLAAMAQAVDLLDTECLDVLTDGLKSADQATFRMALRAARLADPATAARATLSAIEDAPADRHAALLTLLGDLDSPLGLPIVCMAAQNATAGEDTRVAALEALASRGDAQQVPLLLEAADDASPAIAAQAAATLASLSGEAVDRAIVAKLDDPALRSVVVRQIGQRRITSAVPKLLEMLDGPNRLAVIAALGETVSLDQLDVLGEMLSSGTPEVREAARSALHAACYRMPDRDATAQALAEYLNGSEETVAFIMNELRQVGGQKALEIVGSAALGEDELLKDYATRALGGWLDTSPADVLLELAKKEGTSKYGIRGLRAYIRLARQFAMDESDRLAICQTVIEIAERNDEKKLVLEVLERYPSLGGLQIAVDVAGTESLKESATRTAMVIGENIRGKNKEVKALLAQLGLEPLKIEITKARYGAGEKLKDVTATLRQHAGGYPLIILPSTRYNTAFGGDPAPQTPKTLTIEYTVDGETMRATFKENNPIVLPVPE